MASVNTASATLWSTGAYYGSRLLSLVTTVAVARLLTPEEFGLAAYAFVVVTFLDVLRDLGLGPAVVYAEDEQVADTAFWTGLLVGSGAFVACWLAAPAIAAYFHEERATEVIRVLALTFPLYALGNVHDALLIRRLAFRRRLVPELSIAGSRAVLSIGLALAGAGAWSLVGGQVAAMVVGVAVFWVVHPWRPRARASLTSALSLLRYGSGTVTVNALGKLLMNADYLFVGRYLGTQALGVYTLAFRIPELLVLDFCAAIGRVVFPAYARVRADAEEISTGLLAVLRQVSLVTLPLGVLLACTAEPFVLTVFGRPWAAAVDVTRAIALGTALVSLTYNIGDIYKATGRLGLLTRVSLARAALLLPALWWAATTRTTLEAVAWVHVVVAAVMAVVDLEVAARVIGVARRRLLAAFAPAVVASTALAGGAAGVLAVSGSLGAPLQLVFASASGAVCFTAVLWTVHPDVIQDVRRLLTRTTVQEASP